MNLLPLHKILRPHDYVNDPVWSVIILLIILLAGVTYYIVYIMRMAFAELEDGSNQSEGRRSGPADSTPGASY